MEHYVNIKSPLTGGRVKEIVTTETKEFRGEKYKVPVRYYVCEDTGEQFTTTEQDTVQFESLYSQYRTRHGLPSPDEIKEIRLRYGLNYSQISVILGLSSHLYERYENGEIPSKENGEKIAAIKDRKIFLQLIEKYKKLVQNTRLGTRPVPLLLGKYFAEIDNHTR